MSSTSFGQSNRAATNDGFETISLFSGAPSLANVESLVVDADTMKKQGGWGVLVARNRTKAIRLAVLLMLLGVLPILYVFVGAVGLSMRTVAAGVDHWREPDRVVLPSGLVVHSVREISGIFNTDSQIKLTLSDLATRQPLSVDDVKRGFFEWRTSYSEKHNFTLEAAAKTVETVCASLGALKLGAPCACYMYFGVPANIVFLRSAKEVLYEPSIVHEVASKNGTRYGPSAGAIAERVRYVLDKTEFSDTAESALVHYITSRGLKKQRRFAQPELACIKECMVFFEEK